MKRAFLVAVAFATLFHLSDNRLSAQADDLKFRKSYFVTGDYVVAGVGLRGRGQGGVATANINVAGVPPGADIVVAQLYWQVVGDTETVGSVGAKFKGHLLELADDPGTTGFDPEPYAKTLTFTGSAPCFNPGGGTTGEGPFTFTYLLDVLRFLEIDENPASPTFGKTIVNGPHEVQLPDSGPNGNNIPMALGASLFIVFRYPEGYTINNVDVSNTLNSIVLYDDGVSLTNAQRTLLNQPLNGFYKAAATPNAKVSYIAGSGQPNKADAITLPGGAIVSNPFIGSDPAIQGDELGSWDTLTYNVSIPPGSTGATTTVTTDINEQGGRDCITVAAIVFKTAVEDTDSDGLLDVWELAGAPTGQGTATHPIVVDPKGRTLPPLGLMGANPYRKDLYVEVGSMDVAAQVDAPGGPGPWCAWTICDDPDTPEFDDIEATDETPDSVSYGGVLRPPHSHRPSLDALKQFGEAFNAAPVVNNYGTGKIGPNGIAVHFDVGPNYFDGSCNDANADCADHYIIGQRAGESTLLARGGESVNEMDSVTGCVPDATKPWICQYNDFPGTVGWKTGFRFIQDKALSITPTPPTTPVEEYCDQPGYTCVRRFDEVRKNMFHYAFFAHHLGIPESFEPFLPVGSTTVNPAFRKPITNTGVGDFPGGDVLVTLGGFLDSDNVTPIGTSFMQASTLMHEFGHNFQRRHGGDPDEPNCKPPYLSVMNYLYQLRGLLDDLGKPHLGFASPSLQPSLAWPTIVENALTDGSLGVLQYRLGWYTPLIGSYLDPALDPANPTQAEQDLRDARKAKRHCNGTPFGTSAPMMARVDAPRADTTSPVGSIDWNADQTTDTPSPPQDANLDGSLVDTLSPSEDWAKLRLNQVGSRRSPAGTSWSTTRMARLN